MKRIHCLILFVLTVGIASAQENTFLLYSVKGAATVVENKTESPAKVGKVLNSAATIKLSNGAAVTIICNEAAMFTLVKTGSYALNRFGDSCHVSSSSLTSNYVKYVWAQMTSHGEGSPGSNRKAYMNTVGAVSRSINNIWIDPRLDTVNYYSGEFPLSWKSYADAKEFEFELYAPDNITEPFYKNVINKLKISIPVFSAKMKPGTSYYWIASVKGEENEERKILNYVTKETYDGMISKLKTQGAPFEGTAEQAYRMAFMLEDAHYLADAYQYYMKAAAADSTNALYRSTLMSFKKDYELK